MADLNPVLSAAQEALNALPRRQGHLSEIAQQAYAMRAEPPGMPLDEFMVKLSGNLAASVKRKGSPFAKVAGKKDSTGKAVSYRRGMYRLKQVRTIHAAEIHTAPMVDTSYLGKAGELGVMSELLFWGFNASLMTVDEGIDIVASRAGHYYHLQVKTSRPRADGKFYFSIRKAAFEDNHKGTTFYVLVMRGERSSQYAVFPSHFLDSLRRVGGITDGERAISITIAPDAKGRSFTMNAKTNIDHFINGFGHIK